MSYLYTTVIVISEILLLSSIVTYYVFLFQGYTHIICDLISILPSLLTLFIFELLANHPQQSKKIIVVLWCLVMSRVISQLLEIIGLHEKFIYLPLIIGNIIFITSVLVIDRKHAIKIHILVGSLVVLVMLAYQFGVSFVTDSLSLFTCWWILITNITLAFMCGLIPCMEYPRGESLHYFIIVIGLALYCITTVSLIEMNMNYGLGSFASHICHLPLWIGYLVLTIGESYVLYMTLHQKYLKGDTVSLNFL